MELQKVHLNTASTLEPDGSVLVIYTGGTIGMVSDRSGSHLVPFNFEEIMHRMPELRQLNISISVISYTEPIDSSNVTEEDWIMLASIIRDNYEEYDGFVVLHGTDTMAYTASALSYLLENLQKPIIFTGAQVPIGKPRTDARENLVTALEIAVSTRTGRCIVPEVCIYFGNLLLRGNRSKKVESSHFNAFKSVNYPALAMAGVNIEYRPMLIRSLPKGPFIVHQQLERNIVRLKLFPGLAERVIRNLLATKGLKGVVLESYGSGNAPTAQWFLNAMQEAINRGTFILNVSQCDGGRVEQGRYQTSQYLQEMGVIGGADITSEAAVTKLMYVLGLGLPREETRKLLESNLRGEISEEPI
ncbi:asparaginase [Adhaeribacter aquaticus]|uniref:asparaginase n=1 Tax=Adhaeribacter aquaticus TaxID=299567 RepID=UPI000419C573|nr:asparaginase [Adhaeribacter aquaticus]